MANPNDTVQFCPLMSVATNGIDMVCTQSKCAWYLNNAKKCSIYLLGYNALLEANDKKKSQ